jgi:hypothetical protein
VTAVACANVVCTRPVRAFTICGSLSVYVDGFERAVLERHLG